MNERYVVGIDIGLTGAVSCIEDGQTCRVTDLPTVVVKAAHLKPGAKKMTPASTRIDGRGLLNLLREFVPPGEPCMVVIEDVRARAAGNGQTDGGGSNSMHSQATMMRTRGAIESVLDIMGRCDVRWVQPQTWKRHYGLLKLAADEKPAETKGRSLKTARALYPTAPIGLAKHHNRAESLLLAHYGMSL